MPNPWKELLELAKPQINPQTFSTWLKPTRFEGLNGDGRMRVWVPTEEFKVYLTENFMALFSGLLRGKAQSIEYFHDAPQARPVTIGPEPESAEERDLRRDYSRCPEAPEEAWYGPAKLYRQIIGPRVESSDNFHLACFLTMVGASLGKSVYMNVGGQVYPNFYTVIVGESSWSRKTTAMTPVFDLSLTVNPGIIPFSDLSSGEGLIRAIHDSLQEAHEKMQASVLVTLDEYNFLLLKAKQKGNTIIPCIKRAFGVPPVLEVPSSLKKVRIKEPPTFSMLAASETDNLSDMDPSDLKGGLGNRTIFVPGRRKPLNPDSTMPMALEWAPVIENISAMLRFYGNRGVSRLVWSKEAHALWREFYLKIDKRGADDPLISKLAARHCVYIPKTALVFAALDQAEKYVEAKHLKAAIAWCDFLLEGLYYIFRNADIKPWVRESKDIIDYVSRKGGVRLRSLRARFHRLGAETFERRMKYLLADNAHPERELATENRPGGSGRPVIWVVPND